MKTKILLAAATAGVMFAGSVLASTLDDVRARGKLNCIINTGLAGFAAPDDKGNWTGFDVDFCKAVAAATLGDASKVNYTTATGKTRFTKLAAGEGEILSRNTTWTFSRDVDLSQTFVGVSYYDGQGFMAPKALGAKSAKDLSETFLIVQIVLQLLMSSGISDMASAFYVIQMVCFFTWLQTKISSNTEIYLD